MSNNDEIPSSEKDSESKRKNGPDSFNESGPSNITSDSTQSHSISTIPGISSHPDIGFATDLTDGREPGRWESRYNNNSAVAAIKHEAIYVGILALAFPILLLLLRLGILLSFLNILPDDHRIVKLYGASWICGGLGGTIFAIKWLYHTTAKGTWNKDRRLWRYFTPFVSANLSFGLFAVATSGLTTLFNNAALHNFHNACAMGFLVGYFSDSGTAKLTEIANVLFGNHAKEEKNRPKRVIRKPITRSIKKVGKEINKGTQAVKR